MGSKSHEPRDKNHLNETEDEDDALMGDLLAGNDGLMADLIPNHGEAGPLKTGTNNSDGDPAENTILKALDELAKSANSPLQSNSESKSTSLEDAELAIEEQAQVITAGDGRDNAKIDTFSHEDADETVIEPVENVRIQDEDPPSPDVILDDNFDEDDEKDADFVIPPSTETRSSSSRPKRDRRTLRSDHNGQKSEDMETKLDKKTIGGQTSIATRQGIGSGKNLRSKSRKSVNFPPSITVAGDHARRDDDEDDLESISGDYHSSTIPQITQPKIPVRVRQTRAHTQKSPISSQSSPNKLGIEKVPSQGTELEPAWTSYPKRWSRKRIINRSAVVVDVRQAKRQKITPAPATARTGVMNGPSSRSPTAPPAVRMPITVSDEEDDLESENEWGFLKDL